MLALGWLLALLPAVATAQSQTLAYGDAADDRWTLEAGTAKLEVGASSADIRQARDVRVVP